MDIMIEKGKNLIEQGEFQKAQEFFTALLEQSDKNLPAHLWLARLICYVNVKCLIRRKSESFRNFSFLSSVSL